MGKSKRKKIEELFRDNFCDKYNAKIEDVDSPSQFREFKCKYKKDCDYSKETPTWTASFGDEKSTVMIIAESPSGEGGVYCDKISGKWAEDKEKKDEGKRAIIKFAKDQCESNKRWPYFTDFIKCGVAKGTNREDKKENLEKRKDNCFKMFLLKEIGIIKPKKILCIGGSAYEWLLSYVESGELDKYKDKIIKLTHYSPQARLSLTAEEKKEYVWPYEIKKEKPNKKKLRDKKYGKKKDRKKSSRKPLYK